MEHLIDNIEYQVEENWRKLRGLRNPERMKMFLWRAAR